MNVGVLVLVVAVWAGGCFHWQAYMNVGVLVLVVAVGTAVVPPTGLYECRSISTSCGSRDGRSATNRLI